MMVWIYPLNCMGLLLILIASYEWMLLLLCSMLADSKMRQKRKEKHWSKFLLFNIFLGFVVCFLILSHTAACHSFFSLSSKCNGYEDAKSIYVATSDARNNRITLTQEMMLLFTGVCVWYCSVQQKKTGKMKPKNATSSNYKVKWQSKNGMAQIVYLVMRIFGFCAAASKTNLTVSWQSNGTAMFEICIKTYGPLLFSCSLRFSKWTKRTELERKKTVNERREKNSNNNSQNSNGTEK